MPRLLRSKRRGTLRAALACACALLAVAAVATAAGPQRTFDTPEDAVKALIEVVKAGKLDDLIAILGPGSQDLAASSDPVTARQNREVFRIAFKEHWSLIDEGKGKTLIIGNEDWPFPVPIVKDGAKWRFDTAAGKEEVLARRIGRNELETIETCRAYVTAQKRYAQQGHDGKPAGVYAAVFRSDPGKQNGLYWPANSGEKRSPLGDLIGEAADGKGTPDGKPQPFHGYYFKILTAQGAAAPGGAFSYIVNGDLSKGFALVAWPAQYNATGVMTFIVGQDGIVREKDLGSGTDAAARAMAAYNPDKSWQESQ